jgi:predicted dehydrogenase
MYIDAAANGFRDVAQLVGMCDNCQARMDFHNRRLKEHFDVGPVSTFKDDQFDRLIRETQPDTIIVCSPDHTHHHYITRAMHLGCDVVCEKPMTIDAPKARAIFDAIEKTGRRLRVTFNYRFAPHATKLWELIRQGTIGNPLAVDFSWVLNTDHGADYFRRWHAQKDKSGGLLVHKATHHFDLVNWWIDSFPQRVFAIGELKFYGRRHARDEVPADPFNVSRDELGPMYHGLYFGKAEEESGYRRDRDVFDPAHVTIEDTMALVCRYRSGVIMNYSLLAYSPWEGFRIAITGTRGRVELYDKHGMHVVPTSDMDAAAVERERQHAQRLVVHPMFGVSYEVPIPKAEGGHAGGDPLILQQIFLPDPPRDPFKRDATHIDGAASVLLGVAANESIRTGQAVEVDELLKLP